MALKVLFGLLWVVATAGLLHCQANPAIGGCGWVGWSFSVGEYTVVPGQLLLGMSVFGLLVTIVGILQLRVIEPALQRTPLREASRDALVTVAGYFLLAISALFSLSIAGFTLTNLAIIAGALSVGIGFGLQNIVNNFVSGLILLFEQPVKRGDYVAIGGTEGFIRSVHIRYTEIETLDRTSVIVPNSQLISDSVINWQLRDNLCRITVSVGVAYGSDTALVKRILTDVAEAHELVIKGGGILPGPMVQFSNFGDSSLDFQLKAFIQDATRRFMVCSDLRFSIDAAFRENNVTIPFPQRDLWLKAMPTQATSAANASSTESL